MGRFVKALLILTPPLLIGLLIFKYGVDSPVVDEWDGTGPLFEKMADGSLGFGDFFAQHNEHRIFFPRLIFFALGRLTHWNIRAELWVIWFLALLCLFNIWQIARRRYWNSAFWLLLGASVLLFSPLGLANFLWGFQVGFLLPLACVTASIWTAAYVRQPFNFVSAILLCTICTFSIASGFTSWLLTTPLLLLAAARSNSNSLGKWWVIWISLFSLELLLYFRGYEKPAHHPSLLFFSWHPITAIEHILLFLGNLFSHGVPSPRVGIAAGALLLLLFLIAGYYIWSKRSDHNLLEDALPWLMVAMVTITSAVLITLGRAGFGANQARVSRYAPFAAMLPIALIALIPMVYTHWAPSTSTRIRRLVKASLTALLVVFSFLTCAGFLAGLPLWAINRQWRAYGKTLVLFINVVPETDALTRAVFPIAARVKEAATALNRIGYLRPPLMRSNLIANLANNSGSGAAVGSFQFIEEKSGSFAAHGSAFLPAERRPADAVLITYDDAAARGKPKICAIASIGDSGEVVPLRAVWDSSALSSTWMCQFPRNRLPQGQHYYLEAWAFNVDTLQAYRLPGDAFFLW
jgi:hypothetical protein